MNSENVARETDERDLELVGQVHYRPDEPDAMTTGSSGRSSWNLQAIGLGVILLIVMVVMLIAIVQWALEQPPT